MSGCASATNTNNGEDDWGYLCEPGAAVRSESIANVRMGYQADDDRARQNEIEMPATSSPRQPAHFSPTWIAISVELGQG